MMGNVPNQRSATMRVSEEMIADHEGFVQRGRVETVPLTDKDREAHARAVEALAELASNPWIYYAYDSYELEPLEPRQVFVPEETTEEWLARWRASKESA